MVKRAFDVTVVLGAHLFPLLLPVWVLLWTVIPLLVWLEDRGPVFYLQRRVGKDGVQFTIRKFRTMTPDAEQQTGPVWATPGDARVTRIGRVLRATALDELPQVMNVLKGEMSLVGPRAERPELHEQILNDVPDFERRLQVRPGLTGLAQLSGGYDLSPASKLRYDLEYIERMSLWLDIKLILRSVVRTAGARWDQRSRESDAPTPGRR